MRRSVFAFATLAVISVPLQSAGASDLPPIKLSASNQMPACSTPGRMMEFLKSRNPDLDPRYGGIAVEYMRLGEMLGVRWDYAFYQMIIETGGLSYRRGNRAGDVKPSQNNFAGLGATGRGVPGESFKDIATGVRAHLEHLLLYAGEKLDDPVAERTRKVQEWGVLTDWQSKFHRPITYADLAQQWAPGSNGYRKMLEAVAERFAEWCARPDPRPELVQEARGVKGKASPDTGRVAEQRPPAAAEMKTSEMKPLDPPDRLSGALLARRAIDDGKIQGDDRRYALGAQPEAKPASMPFRTLNTAAASEDTPPAVADAAAPLAPAKASDTAAKADTGAAAAARALPKAGAAKQPMVTASAAGSIGAAARPAPEAPAAAVPAKPQKCRVWTASYGGQKAMIIKSVTDKVVNYTVLDVNEGAEAREAEAFIAAYAKDGAVAGQFTSQSQALEKAFELCPEG